MKALTLASYNIRKSFGLDWRRDAKRIHAVLAEMDADIVLLQEVDKRIGSREGTLDPQVLLDEQGYVFADVAIRPKSLGWHGNAILFKQSLNLLSCGRIEIPTVEPRGAVLATFQLADNNQLQVVGAHLSLLRKTRQRQIASLLEQLGQDTQVVIGGDMNEAKAEKHFLPMLSGYQLITPGNSFHTSKPYCAFDRFIVKEKITVLESGVHTSKLAKKASDHLPITMKLNYDI